MQFPAPKRKRRARAPFSPLSNNNSGECVRCRTPLTGEPEERRRSHLGSGFRGDGRGSSGQRLLDPPCLRRHIYRLDPRTRCINMSSPVGQQCALVQCPSDNVIDLESNASRPHTSKIKTRPEKQCQGEIGSTWMTKKIYHRLRELASAESHNLGPVF